MSEEKKFSVIARAKDRDEATFDQIGAALSRLFKLEVTEVAQVLGGEGAVVCRADRFEEARIWAHRVRECGADSLVLDDGGRVVEQQGARRTRGPQSASKAADQTLMGGFHSSDEEPLEIGFKPSSATAASEGSRARSETPLELLDEDAPADPPGAPAAAAGAGLDGLGSLDADNLVLLDGSVEEHAASPAVPAGVSASVPEFAPPAEDESLELDDSFKQHKPGVATLAPELAAEPAAADEPEQEMDWEPVEGEGEPGPALGQDIVRPKPPPAPASGARISGEHARVGGARIAQRRTGSPLELLADFAAKWPRLRIVIGFALALGLGAIAPTCYSQGVYDSQIQPLLVDLSTAKAHGQLLVGTPGYRSPEEIDEDISRVQARYGVYAFFLWLIPGGVLGFLWFHFTRQR
jgi:hypothetical protein